VEIGRLRKALGALGGIRATPRGYALTAGGGVAVLVPPSDDAHGEVLALLADGESWSSSALALALDVSPRTVQRALEALAAAGKVEALGRGPARRWSVAAVPGIPTSLLLPAPVPGR
jgi:DNA-binding transcriptional ArsR family regulator